MIPYEIEGMWKEAIQPIIASSCNCLYGIRKAINILKNGSELRPKPNMIAV
jgi:hypothetical protein